MKNQDRNIVHVKITSVSSSWPPNVNVLCRTKQTNERVNLHWFVKEIIQKKKKKESVHWPGVEPGSTAWKAAMLTVTPPMLSCGA